jgi:hypothetical protein
MTRLVWKVAGCLSIPVCGLVHPGWNTVASAGESQAVRSDALVGVWGTEQVFGPAVRGQLTIDARSAEWRARIAGFDLPIRRDRDAMTFYLPDGAGE